MKKFASLALATLTAAAFALPSVAQEATQTITTPVQPGETALQFAQRVGACGSGGVSTAAFVPLNGGTGLQVQCLRVAGSDLSGGLGGGAAAAGAALVLALFALADDGSTTTTTSTSTN